MFELIAIALFQILSLTSTTSEVGSSGWGHDKTGAQQQTPTTSSNTATTSSTAEETPTFVGSSGWGHDRN